MSVHVFFYLSDLLGRLLACELGGLPCRFGVPFVVACMHVYFKLFACLLCVFVRVMVWLCVMFVCGRVCVCVCAFVCLNG